MAEMEGELGCPVCLDLLEDASSFPCGHLFCAVCITKEASIHDHCPVCRAPFSKRSIKPAATAQAMVALLSSL